MHFHRWDVLSRVAEMAWDVLSGATKMAWDVLSGVTKTAWDVLSGVANRCGMFCPGWQKMAWDVLSRDVSSYIRVCHLQNKRPTLQTLFFTHDIITSSNYAYLSLQTHQLSAISAVIGNMFTIVKLQFTVTLCAHVKKKSLQAREATQKYFSEEESCVVPNEVIFNICSLPVFENNYSI